MIISIYIVCTDGSKIFLKSLQSTSAGMFVWQTSQVFAWKLDKQTTVLKAELYAVLQAINYILTKKKNAAILTDSRTSLIMLTNYKHVKNYKGIIYQILLKLFDLHENDIHIVFQWIPGHCGIRGNDITDTLAHTTHSLPNTLDSPFELSEINSSIKHTVKERYFNMWHQRAQYTQYGQIFSTFQHDNPITNNRLLEKLVIRL